MKQTGLHDRVKMVTPLEMSILGASYPPSAGQVAHAHLEVVSQLVKLLVRIGKGLRVVLLPASFVWYWDLGFVAARPCSCVVSLWVFYNSLAVCRCTLFFMVRVSASRDDSIGCLHRTAVCPSQARTSAAKSAASAPRRPRYTRGAVLTRHDTSCELLEALSLSLSLCLSLSLSLSLGAGTRPWIPLQ